MAYSRTRTRDSRSDFDLTWHRITEDNGTVTVDTTGCPHVGCSVPVGSFESMSDVVTPSYAKKQASGRVINNPMTQTEENFGLKLGTLSYSKPSGSGKYRSTYTNSSNYMDDLGMLRHAGVAIDVESLIKQAGTSAAASIQSPELQGLVSIAELRETVQFLRRPLKSWTDHLDRIHKKKNATRRGRALSTGQFISDNWLAYRYGIRPLVADIDSAAQAVKKAAQPNRTKRHTARGFAEDSGDLDINVQTAYYKRVGTTTRTVKVRAGILYEVETNASPYGLDIEQLPVALWEAIPYSFVVDWLVNVGSYVEAITPNVGVRRLASWTSVEDDKRTRADATATYLPSPWTLESNAHAVEYLTTTTKTRTPGVQIGLVFKPKPLDGLLGIERVTDLFALSEQLLRRR